MDGFEHLKQELTDLAGVSLETNQFEALQTYADLLAQWNQKVNLTAITSPEEIRRGALLEPVLRSGAARDHQENHGLNAL